MALKPASEAVPRTHSYSTRLLPGCSFSALADVNVLPPPVLLLLLLALSVHLQLPHAVNP
jgi:hypothetical protein